MSGFGLNIELDVEESAVADSAGLGFEWFDVASRAALTEPRAALEGLGPVPASPRFVDPEAWNPAGAAVRLSGTLEVSDQRARPFDATSMSWLESRMPSRPERVDLTFAMFAGEEPDSPNVWWPSLYAHRPGKSPGWLRIGAYVAESLFLDERHGSAAQRLWLELLRSFAERCNPGFGQIEYGYDTFGSTALEKSLSPDLPRHERSPRYTVAESRKYLRGYSWLTVLPAELAEQLGGVAALSASGAFAEVSALATGGVWLQATADYRAYGAEQVGRVHAALAGVLRPGELVRRDTAELGRPPHRLVFTSAGEGA
ncbi:hypothetical protein Adi01nite_13770 [Amorphoplanes digitatis]|nr:hypothetical protein GCM10020092_054630 [Actinoplanes digitatis]GID91965.1 hypothetical protein Adi01nite_13770 [Actinoplanes digitatis]